MESLLIARDKPVLNKTDSSLPLVMIQHQWLSYDLLSHHMMSVYLIVRIQLSFVQFSLLCYEFCILSKAECKSIYYHSRRDHKSSSFQNLARNKWICRETYDLFFLEGGGGLIYFINHKFSYLI